MPALPLRARALAAAGPVAAATLVLSSLLVGWALFFGGGDSALRLLWLGGSVLILAALFTAAAFDRRVDRPRIGRLGTACVASYTALVLWQGISITWSVEPDRSWDYVNRGLVYLAFLALGMFIGALVPHAARAAAGALTGLLALVLAYALLAKGIPSLYPDYGRLARLRSPVGFWNALALLGDFALVLGLRRGSRRRFDGALLVFGGAVIILLSYSRGGILIGLLVAAAWLALDRRRLESLLTLVIGGGAATGVFGVSLALDGITKDRQPYAVRLHDGRLFLVTIVIAMAAVAVVARAALRLEPGLVARRRATAALFALVAVGAAAGIAGAALHGSGSTNASSAGTHCTQGVRRLACGSSDARLDWWRQAWRLFKQKPLQGSGAASFDLAHRLHRAEYVRPATEPHNFALQALGETGIVGFLFFAATVAFGALAVRRRIRDDAANALAICVLAYLGNTFIDIGYDYVAVSAPSLLLLGVLLVDGKARVGRREPAWSVGAFAIAGAAVLSLAAPYVAQRKVDEAVATGDPQPAAQAHSWNPVSVDPLLTEAALEESLAHKLKALQLYHQAVDTQPDNPDAWVELGRFQLYGMHDACGAFRSLSTAYGLDRYNPAVATHGGTLDVARTKAKRRGCA